MCIRDSIKAPPVGELAAKDCALFLCITFPCLCEALEVLAAWGFSYKTVALSLIHIYGASSSKQNHDRGFFYFKNMEGKMNPSK